MIQPVVYNESNEKTTIPNMNKLENVTVRQGMSLCKLWTYMCT